MDSPPIFQCSVETRELADFLIATAPKVDCETVISYEQLSKVAGCDVQKKNSILQSARNIALREGRVWYGTVRGEGIRKLDNHELSAEGEDGRQGILRLASRKLRRMAVTEFEKLTDEQKIKHNASASLLGAFHLMGRKTSMKRLEKAVVNASARIPMRGVMRLFGGAASNGEKDEVKDE